VLNETQTIAADEDEGAAELTVTFHVGGLADGLHGLLSQKTETGLEVLFVSRRQLVALNALITHALNESA
jgi:hypothetical protein